MAETDPTTLSINTLRTLAMDAVEEANSGHPGMPMGTAPIAYLLFREVMRHDPADPSWWDRDRFVLSAGHGSMLLYASLHLAGYDRPTLADLRGFRQWGSVTPGHPEHDLLAGVETTTGPLGQGFANGVGMAIAEAKLAAEFNRPGHTVVDHRVYAIVSDGDIMEGVASEAASLAGHLGLGNLIYLFDNNAITIDGQTDLAINEDVLARFDAYGWHTIAIDDGNDLDAIRKALAAAQDDPRPSLIGVRTVIGYGAPNLQGSAKTHGSALGEEEVAAAKDNLGWPYDEPFTVPDAVREHMDRRGDGGRLRADWQRRLDAYRAEHGELAAEFERRMAARLPEGWRGSLPKLDGKAATRKHAGAVVNALADVLPELVGGSADLAASTNTDVKDGRDFSDDARDGRNLRFGVREHAMAAAVNGMALHGGFLPFGATFLIFTDYARPAIRLSALMDVKVIWWMTHDSIGLGEDGPTHQPVEHLASLRAIPRMTVIRPADGDEVVGAFTAAIEGDGPVVIALSRQGLPDLGDKPGGALDAVGRGAYVLRDFSGEPEAAAHADAAGDAAPDVVLIGTGSEVQLCVSAAEQLASDGVGARVVSMPSWELFAAQDEAYRETVLPAAVRARVSVEAATTFGWERWVGDHGVIVGLERFGASAPGSVVLEQLGFTAERVADAARRSLARVRGD